MHVVNRLYEEEFDFPLRDEEPVLTYAIATVPRTGSTYFATLLWRSGVLGAPMEYPNIHTMHRLIERLGRGDLVAYWNELKRRRTSPNGVFGYKLFVNTFERELLPYLTPDRVLYFTRANKAAQAVSYARALQTDVWFAGVKEPINPSYSFEQIRECEIMIKRQEAAWEDIFAGTNTVPLRIEYEQLRNDTPSVLRQVCQDLRIELDPKLECIVPAMKIQSDGLNREWIDRYKQEMIEHGPA
jgi:LPS sulfotransferase NodH